MSETEPIIPPRRLLHLNPIIRKCLHQRLHLLQNAEKQWKALISAFCHMIDILLSFHVLHIPKGYTQAISSKVPTAPNCASHSDEIICSFFAQQASMPTTHDDEDLLQIDEDAMEEIDIRWQVAMLTARIGKFMRRQYGSDISSGDGNLTDSGTKKFQKRTGLQSSNLHYRYNYSSRAKVSFTGIDEIAIRSRVPQAVLSRSTDEVIIQGWIIEDLESQKGSTIESQAVLPQTVKKNAMINPKQTWRPKGNYLDSVNRDNGSYTLKQFEYGNPEEDLKDYAIIDSGCSGSMTGDKDKLSDFKEFKGGYVAFGNDSKGGRISGKGTIKTSCLDFEKVSYVEELKFNLLSVSQICDKKHNVLFTDKECLILSPKFKFVDEDLATEDEAVLWTQIDCGMSTSNIKQDSLLPIQFWAEAVNTACYVLNRVLVTKPQMKTPYEILMGRSPNISFMRPFGCPLTILNTLDHLGKFDGKSEKAICWEDTLLTAKENQKGKGPDWMFDLELLTPSMNYIPVRKENYADSKEQGISCDDDEDLDVQQFIVHGPNIHAAQNKTSEERTADEEVPLSSEEQVLHESLIKGDGKTKWFLEKQEAKNGVLIIKNKARLVAQGYRQEEGVDYDEVSAFLYGHITEKCKSKQLQVLKICHPNRSYRVVKALYGLHQAPRH
ncbi:retrovirus-related pol polyprotein from transposon TNT 1-94 [Tanacetum coccineum]